jgi:predicted dehydrogenase
VYSQRWQRPLWHYWGSDANLAMVAEFVAAIQEQRQPKVTGLDGLKAVEVALAAYRSAAAGQPVSIE